jgi:hypothetical protein
LTGGGIRRTPAKAAVGGAEDPWDAVESEIAFGAVAVVVIVAEPRKMRRNLYGTRSLDTRAFDFLMTPSMGSSTPP